MKKYSFVIEDLNGSTFCGFEIEILDDKKIKVSKLTSCEEIDRDDDYIFNTDNELVRIGKIPWTVEEV